MTNKSNDLHQRWLAHKAYHETFSNPGPIILNYRGTPNRCKCGCGELWYDRVSATNWLKYLSPAFLIETKFLIPIFLSIHKLIWLCPSLAWYAIQHGRASKGKVQAKGKPPKVLTPIIAIPFTVILWSLWPIALALLSTIFFALFGIAIIAVGMFGITLILSGVASLIFVSYPVISVALIFAGIFWEYQRNRRNRLKQEELLGSLVLMVRKLSKQR